ncbi:MAG: glyoxalase [Firmicutes bacterium HGW-Firmicutes-7]|nr:MAG: glyoxalase [Firmicutes bacterium HGW-Firmicutes-7]
MKFICPLIVVKDMKRARHFYEGILGQIVKYDFEENVTFEGDFAIHLENHFKGLINEFEDKVIRHKGNNFELYFESEDLLELELKLMNTEIEFIHKIKEQPWGQRVIRVYDYDGHIVEIGESMETVIRRYFKNGKTEEEIVKKTSMPIEFVKDIVKGI